MSKAKTCEICGHNTPYIDWSRCELCLAVVPIAGKEKTAKQHALRAEWERRCEALHTAAGTESGRIVASGHAQAARDYEARARELAAGEKLGVIVPTIHLNGTSAAALAEALDCAVEAIRAAIAAVEVCAPNGRDYYPQGPDAIGQANRNHLSRLQRLIEVREELATIREQIE